jgi:beta-lactam-binding protein with PASTA domain
MTETNTGKKLRFYFAMAAGLIVIVVIAAVIFFFIALKGEEQTMVPDLQGKELAEALLEMQAKELYPRIQLRFSQSARDKGLILEQEPEPGTIVKAGRRIHLVVSQGAIINRVENFIGKNIDEVRIDLQTFVTASGSPLLTLKEPLMYSYSPAAPGTVIQQKPEPGTDISGPINLELVISQGLENTLITVPQLTGLSISQALEQIGKTNIAFDFSVRDIRDGERGGTVVFQNPAAAAGIPSNTVVELVVNTPAQLFDDEVFNLFVYEMPKNPYPLPVRLEAQLPSGERSLLIGVNHAGGKFAVPYRLPIDSQLILSLMGREIYRETVQDF